MVKIDNAIINAYLDRVAHYTSLFPWVLQVVSSFHQNNWEEGLCTYAPEFWHHRRILQNMK